MVPVGTTLQIWQKCIKAAEPELSYQAVWEVEFLALQALEVEGGKEVKTQLECLASLFVPGFHDSAGDLSPEADFQSCWFYYTSPRLLCAPLRAVQWVRMTVEVSLWPPSSVVKESASCLLFPGSTPAPVLR